MHLATALHDCMPHGLYDCRQFIRTDMRMCIDKNFMLGSMLAKYLQNLFDRTSFFAPGVQFTVGVCTGAAFTETIVGIRVDPSFPVYGYHIEPPAIDIFTTLEDDRLQSKLDKFQSSKQTGRAGTDHNHTGSRRNIAVDHWLKSNCTLIDNVDMDLDQKIYGYTTLTGIDRPADDIDPCDT